MPCVCGGPPPQPLSTSLPPLPHTSALSQPLYWLPPSPPLPLCAQAPTPFLMGMHSSADLDGGHNLEQVVQVDLDK